jgi:hypothetical protein
MRNPHIYIKEAMDAYNLFKDSDLTEENKATSIFIKGMDYEAGRLNQSWVRKCNGYEKQLKEMYSEEEVLQLLLRLQQTESYNNLYDWFEQFKKK